MLWILIVIYLTFVCKSLHAICGKGCCTVFGALLTIRDSPCRSLTHPVASIRGELGVGIAGDFNPIGEWVISLPRRGRKSDHTVCPSRVLVGSSGNPPCPVTAKWLPFVAGQEAVIAGVESITVTGDLINPDLVSMFGLWILTTPLLIANDDLAVMLLSGDWNNPWVVIWILPPLPRSASAMILLFSNWAIVSVLIVMLPPLLNPFAVASIALWWRSTNNWDWRLILPLLPAAVLEERVPLLSNVNWYLAPNRINQEKANLYNKLRH